MPVTEIKRPNFYEGQYLGAADLVAGQEYQRQQDQRHRLGAHTWGIAVGLELEERPQPGSSDAVDVYIKAGYAVDGFGRAIVVLAAFQILESLFAQYTYNAGLSEGQWIAVSLRYRENKTDPAPPGFALCDVEQDQSYRILEAFDVVVGDLPLVAQQRDQISVAGKSLDAADEIADGSVPYQAFPDDGQSGRWLIRLGSVRWLAPNPPATTTGHFVKSVTERELEKARDGRPYIGVVAERVLAPAGVLRIADRFSDPLPVDPKDPHYAGVAVTLEGSLEVDRLLHAMEDIRWGNNSQLQRDQGGSIELGGDSNTAGTGTPYIDFHYNGKIEDFNTRIINDADGQLTVDAAIFRTLGSIRWGNNSQLQADQGGSIELGGDANTAGTGTPYIDFHYNGKTEDFNTRIINDADKQLTADAGILRATGNVTVAGNLGIGTAAPVSKLQIGGDLAIEAISSGSARALPTNGTIVWNDGRWLRLNQNLDFSKPIFGVHTPGVFAPSSLNVGGGANWGDPGAGNAWITGNLSIGTTAPARKLHVVGDRIRLESGDGQRRIDLRTDGSAVDLQSETSDLYVRSSGNAGNNRLLLNPFPTDGNVGIGTRSPGFSFKLDVAGSAHASSFRSSSDDRLKMNIKPLKNVLERVQKIRGVSFDWNERYTALGRATGKPEIGVLAQEVEAVFPELTSRWGDEEYLAVDYGRLTAVLLEAIKELASKVPATGDSGQLFVLLEAFNRLKTDIEAIKTRLHELEHKIQKSSDVRQRKVNPRK